MRRNLVITAAALAAMLTAALSSNVAAAPINISVDIDSTRISGTNTTGTITTQPGFTSFDTTNVGTSGTMTTVDGITFEIFGLAAANQSRVRTAGGGGGPNDSLLTDFVFNEGATGRAVGLRISGLDVGAYQMQSWHFDSDAGVRANENFIQVEVRNQGGTGTTLVDSFPFSENATSFGFSVSTPGQVKEVVFREDDVATTADPTDQNRARLNGFTIRTIPEPGSLVLIVAACLAACFRRGIRSN
jgi:hypothetical protein